MAEPTSTLPPFAALRAFHAAAVHGRFRAAAQSLGVAEIGDQPPGPAGSRTSCAPPCSTAPGRACA